MPNWCYNRLVVKGPAAELARFKKVNGVKGDGDKAVFSFWGVAPVPPEVEAKGYDPGSGLSSIRHLLGEKPKKGVVLSGYEWRNLYWGTKWDAGDASLKTTRSSLTYNFDTAWSPPEAWFAKLAEAFPEVEINMFSIEEQPEYAIHYKAVGGQVSSRDYLDRKQDNSLSLAEIKEAVKMFDHGPIFRGICYMPGSWSDEKTVRLMIKQFEDDGDETVAYIFIRLSKEVLMMVVEQLIKHAPRLLDRTLADEEEFEHEKTSNYNLFKDTPEAFRKKLGAFAIKAEERATRLFGIKLLGSLQVKESVVVKPTKGRAAKR